MILSRISLTQRRLLPWAGLLLSLLVTAAVWQTLRVAERTRLAEIQRARTDAAAERLERRMSSLIQILRGASGFLSRKGSLPNHVEWHGYVEGIDFAKAYPGIQGLGFAEWIPTGQKAAHERRLQAEGFLDYRVSPGGPLAPDPAGCSSIIYLEPMDERNQRAFGKDMWAESIRRAAMARARDTGLPSLTAAVTLFQEGAVAPQVGTLLYVPVYRPGPELASTAQRRERLMGWAYYPIRMTDMMHAALTMETEPVAIGLLDVTDAAQGIPLYRSNPESGEPAGLVLARPFEIAGRAWTLQVGFGPKFMVASGARNLNYVFLIGAVVGLLLFGVLNSEAHAAAREQAAAAAKEAELLASEAQFKAFFEHAPVGMAIVNPESGRFLSVNPRLGEMLGFGRAELLARSFMRVTHPDDLENSLVAVAALRRGEVFEVSREKRYLHRNGQVVWGRLSLARLTEVPGADSKILAVVEDITEQRSVQEALLARETLFRTLFDLSPDPCTITDLETGKVIHANQAFAEISGHAASEVVGQNTAELGVWAQSEGRQAMYEQLRRDGSVGSILTQMRRKDGTEVPVAIAARVITLEGKPCVLAASKNVSALVAAQEAFRQEHERLTRILTASKDAMHIIDRTGRLKLWNPAFLSHLGYTEAEAAGLHVADWDRRWQADEFAAVIHGLMTHPRTFETVHQRKDGTQANMEISATGILIEGEEMLFASARDVTARYQVEAALRESEAMFRTFFEKNLAVMLLVDPVGGAILDANDSASLFYGWSRDALRRMSMADLNLLSPEAVRSEMEQARSERRKAFRFKHRRAGGEVRDVAVYSSPILQNGKALLFSIVHDVSDEVAARSALTQSEARFRNLFDVLPVGVTLTDGQGNIVQTNAASERLLGIPSNDLLRREFKGPYWEIVRPDGSSMPAEEYASVRALHEGRRVENVEMGVRRPDGGTTWITVSAEPLDGGRGGVLIVYIDLSERKRSEDSLRESEARWRFALDGSGEGVWDWNAVTNEVYFSPQWKAMLGYRDAEIEGSLAEWDNRVHPEDKAEVSQALEAYFRGDTPVYENEHRVRCKDGSYKWILDRGMVVSWVAPGKPRRVIGTHTDITDRRQLADTERRAQKAESLVLMAGSIAHDFNNLFQALQSSLETAGLMAQGNQRVEDALRFSTSVLRRAITLSLKMLDFSGQAVARLERMDIAAALATWGPELAQGLGESLRLDLDLGSVPLIQGDPIQLRRVVEALLINAKEASAHFTQHSGRVRLRLFVDYGEDHPGPSSEGVWGLDPPTSPATVCLEIADEGPGVDPTVLPRMFDPFFTTKELGRGLGLATVVGLLNSHHAGIHVFPGAERGLTFRIHFPPAGV